MIDLRQGDCLEIMKDIPDKSIDMILADLPYQATKNKWDSIIPLEPLWEQYKRIIKDNGAIVLFGQGKFTAKMMLSEPKLHRYNLIWDKVLSSGFLNANRMPLRSHEDIMVFYKRLPKYNPQKTKGKPNNSKGKPKQNENNNYGHFEFVDNKDELGGMKHPKSIVIFEKPHPSISIHPTQKPVELLEYLIKTYTKENDIVLDNVMGSGSTGVACINTNRNFIGIELDEDYFEIARKRIEEATDDWHRKFIVAITQGGIVKYIQLADKYTRITTEITYLEDLIKHDTDLALVRQLEQLRKEQKEVASLIDEYNGVKNNDDRRSKKNGLIKLII